jgi:hypothetical protein
MAARAAEVAAEVAGRLADAGQVRAHAGDIPSHRALPGCAMLAARASAGRQDLAGAATTLCRAATDGLPATVNSIAQGTTGVAAAALVTHAMTGDERLLPIISSSVPWLSGRVLGIAGSYRGHGAGGGPAMLVAHYDAMTGLAGLGRLLLMTHQDGHPGAERGLEAALDVLTCLLSTGGDRPGWWAAEQDAALYVPCDGPGTALTGMAHGVAGPVAFLAIATRAGHVVGGQREAIRAAAGWLLDQRQPADTWPRSVPEQSSAGQPAGPRRWCTGSSGIAAALHLAGLALEEPPLVEAGVSGLAAVNSPASGRWDIVEPILCCGAGGVLESILTARHANPDPRLDAAADTAAAMMLAWFQPDTPFGFPRTAQHVPADAVDTVDLLHGASGAALALYDYAHGVTSTWPAMLLLR